MIVEQQGHPKIGVPIILLGMVFGWFAAQVTYLWPNVFGVSFLLAIVLVAAGVGVASPHTYEVGRNGKILPRRGLDGKFIRD